MVPTAHTLPPEAAVRVARHPLIPLATTAMEAVGQGRRGPTLQLRLDTWARLTQMEPLPPLRPAKVPAILILAAATVAMVLDRLTLAVALLHPYHTPRAVDNTPTLRRKITINIQ